MKIGNSENRSLRIEFDWKNHKFGTILEVLRIGFVVTSLIFFVLAAFGCKDKAEAIEISDPVDITIEANELFKIEETDATDLMFCYDHNGVTEELTLSVIDGEIVCSQPANKAIEIIFKTMYYTWGEQNKGDVYDLPVRFPEPDEPLLKIETEATDNWLEAVERWPDAQGYITDNFGRTTPMSTFTKPDEPEESIIDYVTDTETSWSCGRCGKELSPYEMVTVGVHQCGVEPPSLLEMIIPTWPNYIELEKTLIIREPADIIEIAGREHDFSVRIELAKGTKIYFKEDE